MNNDINTILINILNQYKNNELNQEEILSKIKEIYFEDIGFAKIDHHRELRRGFPEVIFGANKTPKQILEIAKRILKYSSTLLVTKTTKECFKSNFIQIPFTEDELLGLSIFNSKFSEIYTQNEIENKLNKEQRPDKQKLYRKRLEDIKLNNFKELV